jgi:hypothetical protein
MPRRRSRRTQLIAFAIAVVAVLAAGAPNAFAGQLHASYPNATLTYQAGNGENNKVTAYDRTGQYEVDDTGISVVNTILDQLNGNGSCTTLLNKVKCGSSGISQLVVNLADGSDTVNLSATTLPATVNAGAGAKDITGGQSADTINAVNGSADHISCGTGVDTVSAESIDSVSADCEHVSIDGAAAVSGTSLTGTTTSGSGGSAGAGSTSTGQASNLANLPPIGLLLPAQPVVLTTPGTAVVTLGCAADAPDDCRGDIYLELPAGALGGSARGRLTAARGHYLDQQRRRAARRGLTAARGHYVTQQRRLAHRKFNIARGKKKMLPMRIAFRGHYAQVVRRRRIRATLRIVQRDRAGNVIGMATRTVTLHAAANKWSRKRPNRRSRSNR